MRFGMTGKIAAKADRARDPFEYIDDLRQEVVEVNEWQSRTDRRLQILEDAERKRLTETGVWRVVRDKLDDEAIDWVKWGVRAAFCGFGTLMLSGMGWIIARIFKT
jgi:hypothetical protein